ncbi:MAG: aldo/keto reductase [Candidatus Aenigmarchaeota archaeon]|nr:aldo/keto reductase [Candidatus Aenigmarchaeota archaeon]
MNYRRLGRTGFEVSEIGHGLWGMGLWSGSDDKESKTALQLSLDSGCNFFDSAWAYGDGRSDSLLGELIRNNPDKRILTSSKIPPKNMKWPASSTDKYEDVYPLDHVLKYTELIKKALGVESIDVLHLHVWDDSWADNSVFLKTAQKLKDEGLIRTFAISLNRWEPENGIEAIKTGLIDVVQVIYNIFDQAPEDKLFPLCKKMDVGIIARVPLDEGSLGGKLTINTKFPPSDWRAKYFGPENLSKTIERVENLKSIVPNGMTLPEMALRFILTNKQVGTTIIGMRKLEHIKSNFSASDKGPLDANLIEILHNHRWDRKVKSWSN